MKFSKRAERMQPSAIRQMTKLAAAAGAELIAFAGGMPSPATFPLQELAQIAAAEIRDHHGRSLQYGMTTGYRPLVQWICDYIGAQQVACTPANVVCTTGSQQAIDLICEVLIDPEDTIFVEAPTYLGALAVFEKMGARIVSVRQDESGIAPDDLEEQLRKAPRGTRKLIYIISNFQNPSGISLAEDRRKALAKLLGKWDAYLIEDDPYGEIYFGDDHRPCLPVKHHENDRVLYLGTFSKLVAPTFRTGWVAACEPLAYRIELAKEAADLCGSMFDQRILYRFCSAPEFVSHLKKLRLFYAERCRAMLDALTAHMPGGVSWTHPKGGFFIWLRLPGNLDSETMLEESISKENVSYVIGRPFSSDSSTRDYIRLAFSVEEPARIRDGIARLAALIKRRL
jgi:2-aminoadipate transaminase